MFDRIRKNMNLGEMEIMLEHFINYLGEAILLVRNGEIFYRNPAAKSLLGPLFDKEDIDLDLLLPEKGGMKYSQATIYNKEYVIYAWDAGEAFALSFALQTVTDTRVLSALSTGLRQPVSSLYNSIRRLSESPLGNKEQNSFGSLVRNLYQLMRLMLNIECIVKCEKGEPCETLQVVNISELINTIAAETHPYADAFDCELTVVNNERITLCGYTSKIRQAIYNLVCNALEYAGKQGIIRVKTQKIGETVSISVSNSGNSIDPAQLFHMADIHNSFSMEGMIKNTAGVGLALVKSVAKLHGGSLMIESGSGTTVTFTLNDIPSNDRILNSSGFGDPDSQWIRPQILFSSILKDRDYIDELF